MRSGLCGTSLRELLHYAEFADGIALLTSVGANGAGVYVSGYASEGLAGLVAGKGGLITDYPLAVEAKLIREGRMLEANGLKDKDPIAGPQRSCVSTARNLTCFSAPRCRA